MIHNRKKNKDSSKYTKHILNLKFQHDKHVVNQFIASLITVN